MSIPVRHSGRIAFAALIVITLIAGLLGVRLVVLAQAPPTAIDTTTDPSFTIGPIEGLTTTWHWAPPATSIPLGTLATFFQPASRDTTVIWTGADEVARDDQGSTAFCWLVLPGITTVQVEIIPADGGEALASRSVLNVVDVPIEQITVSAIDVWVDPVEIDEDLPQDELNELTMGYFFGPSIAALRDLGDGQYRTSVNRKVHMSVEVNPPDFAPLIEWRFDGQPVHAPPALPGGFVIDPADGMGTSEQWRFLDIGNHLVEVGPWLNPEQIEIETYSVTITSHTSGQDIIPEGEAVLFIAETDPPGYENEITWLSSTLYGTAEPILGEGPIFIAEFNDTWGIDENGDPFQWLGVRADNAAFNQDQKLGACCFEILDLICTDGVTERFCDPVNGIWIEGATCADNDGDGVADLCERGACCFFHQGEIVCASSHSESACNMLGDDESGEWQGAGSICADVDCDALVGACCFPDGSCSETTEQGCNSIGGTFSGAGILCARSCEPISPCNEVGGFCSYDAALDACLCSAVGGPCGPPILVCPL